MRNRLAIGQAKCFLVVLLCFVMIIGLIPVNAFAYASGLSSGDGESVTEIKGLSQTTYFVDCGTEKADIGLPSTVSVTITRAATETSEATTRTADVDVVWDGAYDGDTAGDYTLTAAFADSGFSVDESVVYPAVTVTVDAKLQAVTSALAFEDTDATGIDYAASNVSTSDLSLVLAASGAVIPVTDYAQLQAAINGAVTDGTQTEILLNGAIDASTETVPIDIKSGQNILLSGSGSIAGKGLSMVSVESGGELAVDGITFTNSQFLISGSLVLNSGGITKTQFQQSAILIDGGRLEMNGGSISENVNTCNQGKRYGPVSATAPIIVKNGGSMEINGGEIKDNKNWIYGGAILARDDNTTVTVNDGLISGNQALSDTLGKMGMGGGILTASNAILNINGGTIEKNTACAGGGVCILGATLIMNGGQISENRAVNQAGNSGAGGGGICLSSPNDSEINAGVIDGNTAEFYGGGIYVMTSSKLTMNSVLVTGNVADLAQREAGTVLVDSSSAQGGGVWNCPDGSSTFHINRGIAIVDNTAKDLVSGKTYVAGGDDFANVYNTNTPPSYYDVDSRMLGGGLVKWYKDGSVSSYGQNKLPADPRYDLQNPGEAITPFATVVSSQANALKSLAFNEAKGLAETVSKVRITNNKSWVGGGIANNGTLEVGFQGPYALHIKKEWKGDESAGGQRPVSITAKLYVGDYYVEDVTLTAENNWEADVKDFPNPEYLTDSSGNKLEITLQEASADGYTLTQMSTDDSTNSVLNITMTNTLTSSDAADEKTSETATSADTYNAQAPSTDQDSPQTGDNNMPLCSLAILLSLLGLGVCLVAGKKRRI